MLYLKLPTWLKQHLYTQKGFADLSNTEIEDLKQRIKVFTHDTPDVSVVIPAWNEENNIFRAVSSLASNITNLKVEIIVINNNSSDRTQMVLDTLGIRSYLQPEQGTPHARQMGLYKAKGKYHLCADSDTFYPPRWIELMTKPMQENNDIVGVYGRYCFIPLPGGSRLALIPYEKLT
uniref:glycosyltransferase family 2 protein n=1 Tax=Pedobacter glucosidilyticus TaxID=1122941 RepID=UPI0026EF42AF